MAKKKAPRKRVRKGAADEPQIVMIKAVSSKDFEAGKECPGVVESARLEFMQNSRDPNVLIQSSIETLGALQRHCDGHSLEGPIVVASLETIRRELEAAWKDAFILQRRENLARRLLVHLSSAPTTVLTPAGAVAWERWKQEAARLLESAPKEWNPGSTAG